MNLKNKIYHIESVKELMLFLFLSGLVAIIILFFLFLNVYMEQNRHHSRLDEIEEYVQFSKKIDTATIRFANEQSIFNKSVNDTLRIVPIN